MVNDSYPFGGDYDSVDPTELLGPDLGGET
jgi:hypothetical protein